MVEHTLNPIRVQDRVLGFYRIPGAGMVLITQDHPGAAFPGLVMGVGGTILDSEMPLDAMVRHFLEQTGWQTPTEPWSVSQPEAWRMFAFLSGPGYHVRVYSAIGQALGDVGLLSSAGRMAIVPGSWSELPEQMDLTHRWLAMAGFDLAALRGARVSAWPS